MSLTQSRGWIFASGNDHGLQLRLERIAETALHRISPTEGENTWLLRTGTTDGVIACTLAPTDYDSIPQWEKLLFETLTPYAITNKEP